MSKDAIKKYRAMVKDMPVSGPMYDESALPASWITLYDFGKQCATILNATPDQAKWLFDQQEIYNIAKHGSRPIPTKFFTDRWEDFTRGFEQGVLESEHSRGQHGT